MSGDVTVSRPSLGDGVAMWRIARDVGLDTNSQYKYLVFCRDFPDTSVVARQGDEVLGFVTGYRRPRRPGTLFVWQVGVHPEHRGHRIAARMLDHLVGGPGPRDIAHVEATITPENAASQRLFAGFAERHGAAIRRSVLFPAGLFDGDHADEVLVRIGPLGTRGRGERHDSGGANVG